MQYFDFFNYTKQNILDKNIINISLFYPNHIDLEEKNQQDSKQEKIIHKVNQKTEKISDIAHRDVSEDSLEEKQHIKDLSYSNDIYDLGSKENPLPPYPRMAKVRNYQGKSEIKVIADINGKVVDISILKSSGYAILDKSALNTIKKWQFHITEDPDSAIKNQYYKIIVPINFVLS